MNEEGAAGVAVLAVAATILLFTMALTAVAGIQNARLRATTAADAAALAAAPVTFLPFGATGTPTDEAGRFARLNGASLLWCSCRIDRTFEPRIVEVRVRSQVTVLLFGGFSVEATGRAEFTPAALLAG